MNIENFNYGLLKFYQKLFYNPGVLTSMLCDEEDEQSIVKNKNIFNTFVEKSIKKYHASEHQFIKISNYYTNFVLNHNTKFIYTPIILSNGLEYIKESFDLSADDPKDNYYIQPRFNQHLIPHQTFSGIIHSNDKAYHYDEVVYWKNGKIHNEHGPAIEQILIKEYNEKKVGDVLWRKYYYNNFYWKGTSTQNDVSWNNLISELKKLLIEKNELKLCMFLYNNNFIYMK